MMEKELTLNPYLSITIPVMRNPSTSLVERPIINDIRGFFNSVFR